MLDPAPPSSRRAARDRRYRARQRRCAAVAPVEFDGDMIDFLQVIDWLKPHEVEDKAAIGEAIGEVLREVARAMAESAEFRGMMMRAAMARKARGR